MNGTIRTSRTRPAVAGLAMAAVLALGGCAGMFASSPEAAVETRANARWQALVKGDFDSAYDLLPPSVRATRSKQDYRSSFAGAVRWIKAEVVRVECEAQRCEAMVRVEAAPLIRRGFDGNIVTHIPETWINENGSWWFFAKP